MAQWPGDLPWRSPPPHRRAYAGPARRGPDVQRQPAAVLPLAFLFLSIFPLLATPRLNLSLCGLIRFSLHWI